MVAGDARDDATSFPSRFLVVPFLPFVVSLPAAIASMSVGDGGCRWRNGSKRSNADGGAGFRRCGRNLHLGLPNQAPHHRYICTYVQCTLSQSSLMHGLT